MCGIVGFVGEYDRNRVELVAEMARSIDYRGPDDSGEWTDDVIAFGHRRLSILDLSPLGHQPMLSASGRFVTVFNGEIYNFQEIKAELESHGFSFRGGSDTEVLLAAVEHWGVKEATGRFNGMFAFAIWDRRDRVLHLVRDRLGVKPLYFGWLGSSLSGGSHNSGMTFCFASEVKPFVVLGKKSLAVDEQALAAYMATGYVPAPLSIYRGIYKLLPGSILTLTADALGKPLSASESCAKLDRYWTVENLKNLAANDPFKGSYEEAVDQLEALLLDSVRLRMIADVPVGAFLSGGIDSSTIVALMQKISTTQVRTFTIGFDQAEYDESLHARAVANVLGTNHTELTISAQEALDVVPLLPKMFDEPFADSSQIPSYIVAKLARTAVTVSLSGDGGDELFMGYNRYLWPERIWSRLRYLPLPIKMLIRSLLLAPRTESWDSFYDFAKARNQNFPSMNKVGEKMHKLAKVVGARSVEEIYIRALSHWENVDQLVIGSDYRQSLGNLEQRISPFLGGIPRAKSFMLFDQSFYLPDDLLTKADRTSMFVSLEGREPVIDYRIAEFAARLPVNYCVENGRGKRVLRDVLYRYVPAELVDRPKMGFSVPIGSWLRGGLRQWAGDLLSPEMLKKGGHFNAKMVEEKWQEHQSGKRNWQHYLWDVLMFQAWFHS